LASCQIALSIVMPKVYTLEHASWVTEEFFGVSGYRYETDTGFLPFYPIPAWCKSCKDIEFVEDLPTPETLAISLATLELELADHELTNSQYFAKHGRNRRKLGDVLAEIRECKLRQNFLQERKSRARCLKCGSEEVHIFTISSWEPHPATGTLVRLTWSGMCTVARTKATFDNEGIRLVQRA
jgi:Zn finger protein HypA/HybF involved in hydrogenase expression